MIFQELIDRVRIIQKRAKMVESFNPSKHASGRRPRRDARDKKRAYQRMQKESRRQNRVEH